MGPHASRRRWLELGLCGCLAVALTLASGARPVGAGAGVDWVIEVDPQDPGAPLPTALLGHYDLSGALFGYDEEIGLAAAMKIAGLSDWRVGVGRWEAGTWLLPLLSDGTTNCGIALPEQAAPGDDLTLIAMRDWFSDDGLPVGLPDTQDDDRYQLAYLRSVLDVVDAFGATPFVSIDSMPRALAVNRTPLRTDCAWTFQNQVSNVRPANPAVFAAAAAGLVERVVEGSGSEPARAVSHWEVWNEPEFPQFWDPAFEDGAGPLDRYFEMAIQTLLALDGYRAGSGHPNAAALRFGLGSFGTAAVAATTLAGFDTAAVPGGHVPLDFISFHAYSDDPLQVAAAVDTVAAAAAATTHYPDVELALAEWGPDLASSAGDPIYAASIQPALHIATVLSLGAAAGLDRAHRAIFWDFYPDSIRLGLLDNDLRPRPAYRAYELLSRLIREGAVRVDPVGIPDGRLDGGNGAVLVGREASGTTRVLLVNRGASQRIANVLLAGSPATPIRVLRYADPAAPIEQTPGVGPDITVPAMSLVLAEFGSPAVPGLGPFGGLAVFALLLCAWRSAASRVTPRR